MYTYIVGFPWLSIPNFLTSWRIPCFFPHLPLSVSNMICTYKHAHVSTVINPRLTPFDNFNARIIPHDEEI